jgi:hypothetical protein
MSGLPPPGRPPFPTRDGGTPDPQPAPAPSTVPARRVKPVKGKGLSPAQRAVTPMETAAFAALEVQAGGRSALVDLLAHAPLGKDVDYLVGLMADPANDDRSLAQVCAEGKFGLAKVYAILDAAVMARAKMHANQQVARHLPLVVEGVMRDAVEEMRVCPECHGERTIEDGFDDDGKPKVKNCPKCKGRGEVLHLPETDTRKLALQMGRMIDSGNKSNVTTIVANQNSQTNAGSGGVNFDALMTRLDQHLYDATRQKHRAGYGETVDAELAGESE